MWIPKHLKWYTQHAIHQHKSIHVIFDWFSYVIFTNNFWQELDLAYLVPLLLALLWFLKHVVLLQVGRAALYATPPFTCPVTSSLLRTQATLSHVRWIHPPSPSWLPPVLCQCWRSHGTPACLDGAYISKALWCGLWRHSFCACPIRSSTALHARWLFTWLVLIHVRVAWLNSWLRSRWAGFPWSQRQALDLCRDKLGPSALTKFPQTCNVIMVRCQSSGKCNNLHCVVS